MGRRTAGHLARAAVTAVALAVAATACSPGASRPAADDRGTPVGTTASAPVTTARSTAVPVTTVPTLPSPPVAAERSVTTSASPGPGTTDTTATSPGPTGGPSTSGGVSAGWPDVGIAGVNDDGCTDPRPPVLLLHGTFSTTARTLAPPARHLVAEGRCVFALDYGWWATASVRSSSTRVADFTRRVLAATGAEELDVIGHSQGGLVLRTALRLDGLAPVVRTAVLLAPSFHGTTLDDWDRVSRWASDLCPACADQQVGSDLLRELDRGGDLDGDVRYFVLSTRRDTIVVPVSGQVPRGPEDRVTATTVEDLCPTLVTDHVGLTSVPATMAWVDAALDHRVVGPGDVPC